jgi:hypothetical protein
VSGRAWNSRTYTARPPAQNRGARKAWDFFVKQEQRSLPIYEYGNAGSFGPAIFQGMAEPHNRTPKAMWRTHMDYWVWVMEFENGDYEEIDAMELR